MFGESLDLSDVLKKLRRADEALTEFVAPLWPGVTMAAAWLEGRVQLFRLDGVPEQEGYYLLGTNDDRAHVLRPAQSDETRRFMNFLESASVILLEDDLAFPASAAERLQGITFPRPIHFANGETLRQVLARFDGLNLFFDSSRAPKTVSDPLSGLFSNSSIFTPGELLGIPGADTAGSGAEAALHEIQQHHDLVTEYRLRAVLEPAGAVLEEWTQLENGAIRLHWRLLDEDVTVTLRSAACPITCGICLPGVHGFDPANLSRTIIEHALDEWRKGTNDVG